MADAGCQGQKPEIRIDIFLSLHAGSRLVSNRVRATKFEFERRFWIIAAIYAVGFSLSVFDPVRTFTALRHLFAPSLLPGSSQDDTFARLVITAGALLVFLAAALRTWASAYLRTGIVHDTDQHSDALVADGPFRHVRNPLYFAIILMAAGIGLLASPAGLLFLVGAHWLLVYRLIFREEEALRQSQGECFLAYCSAVPRLWPSLTPRVPSGNHSAQWGQAFAGETFIWIFGLAELCLAITLKTGPALAVFGLGFVAYFIMSCRVRKRS